MCVCVCARRGGDLGDENIMELLFTPQNGVRIIFAYKIKIPCTPMVDGKVFA